MVSNIADDDFEGKVCKEGQYPLTRTLSETLLDQKVTLKTTLQEILLRSDIEKRIRCFS